MTFSPNESQKLLFQKLIAIVPLALGKRDLFHFQASLPTPPPHLPPLLLTILDVQKLCFKENEVPFPRLLRSANSFWWKTGQEEAEITSARHGEAETGNPSVLGTDVEARVPHR